MRQSLFAVALFAPGLAFACPGKTADASAADSVHAAESVHAAAQSTAELDAAACAKKAALVGSSCSYSTGMMASRVLDQGKVFTYTGTLRASDAKLESQVAAPFVIGPTGIHVIANEVVEAVADPAARMTWTGKVLEVDGVQYFVLTGYEKSSV